MFEILRRGPTLRPQRQERNHNLADPHVKVCAVLYTSVFRSRATRETFGENAASHQTAGEPAERVRNPLARACNGRWCLQPLLLCKLREHDRVRFVRIAVKRKQHDETAPILLLARCGKERVSLYENVACDLVLGDH
jgi:hypothetical protein